MKLYKLEIVEKLGQDKYESLMGDLEEMKK